MWKLNFIRIISNFNERDILNIENDFINLQGNKLILTTEKDAARIKSNAYLSDQIRKKPIRIAA